MDAATSTPADLLRTEMRSASSRPLVTFYDDATGERVELSVATFDNWVAKTAGFMTDGLNVDVGDRVSLLLPAHWQALVWASACWSVGACVVTDPASDVEVAVAGPDRLADAVAARPAAVVGLALRPLGGRFADELPAGVLDYAAEVPGYPDHFVPITPVVADEPALDYDGAVRTLGGLLEHARDRTAQLDAPPGARLMVSTDDLTSALVDALLVPLVLGGSAVLVRHESVDGRADRVAAERVTVSVPPRLARR